MYLIYFIADKGLEKKGEEIHLMIYFISKKTKIAVTAVRSRGTIFVCICTVHMYNT